MRYILSMKEYMSWNNRVIVSVGSDFPTAFIIAFKYSNIDKCNHV